MAGRKLLTLLLVIGIVFVITGPILGYLLDEISLADQKPATITETSNISIQSAFKCEFSLERNQKISIEFAVYYPNITARLKILYKYIYDEAYGANSSPNALTGEYFISSTFRIGSDPQLSIGNLISITDQGQAYLEFTGSAGYTYFISKPGDYVVIVYGFNSGAVTDVYFDISIKIDGPGGFLSTLFITIGIVVLVCYALLLAYSYLNRMRRGR